MAILAAFQPTYGAGATKATSTTSAAYVLDANGGNFGGGNKSVRLVNLDATDGVYVRIGSADTITATTADFYLAPGQQCVLSKSEQDNYIALKASANTPSVNYIVGEGLCIT